MKYTATAAALALAITLAGCSSSNPDSLATNQDQQDRSPNTLNNNPDYPNSPAAYDNTAANSSGNLASSSNVPSSGNAGWKNTAVNSDLPNTSNNNTPPNYTVNNSNVPNSTNNTPNNTTPNNTAANNGTNGSTNSPGYANSTALPNGGNNNNSDRANALDNQDRQFVEQAAASGAYEVQSGEVALNKSNDGKIKQIAQHLIDDHKKMNDQLAQVARQEGMTNVPTSPNADQEKKIDKLNSLSGADFDKEYLKQQDNAHQQAIVAFQQEERLGKDANLRNFAGKGIPILTEHLKMVQDREMGSAVGSENP